MHSLQYANANSMPPRHVVSRPSARRSSIGSGPGRQYSQLRVATSGKQLHTHTHTHICVCKNIIHRCFFVCPNETMICVNVAFHQPTRLIRTSNPGAQSSKERSRSCSMGAISRFMLFATPSYYGNFIYRELDVQLYMKRKTHSNEFLACSCNI